ncbi:MAG: chorismate mutase [Myxococcales bacterium]
MTTPTIPTDLAALREEISEINDALLELLSRRAHVATAIQRIKSREGIPTFVPEREQAMLVELVRKNPGPFSNETVARLFKEIFAPASG